MEEFRTSRPPMVDFYGILGISKGASIADMCKAYETLVMKWNPDKNPSNKSEAAQAKFQQITEDYKAPNEKKTKEKLESRDEPKPTLGGGGEGGGTFGYHNSVEGALQGSLMFPKPLNLLKSLSRRSQTPLRTPARRSTIETPGRSPSPSPTPECFSHPKSADRRSASVSETETPSFAKSASRRSPIVYSQSSARRKPPPIEKKLECTLEELSNGCFKHVKITRDVIRTGIIEEEEEILKIRVNPGWRKGTKITFQGKGDERPGFHPADIILIMSEKEHPLFKRKGDNLECKIQLRLVEALTGCTISVPLISGDRMSLSLNEIAHPGFEKVIPGQGMPNAKEEGKRGNLTIKFNVNFPTELSDEQRAEVSSVLQGCF